MNRLVSGCNPTRLASHWRRRATIWERGGPWACRPDEFVKAEAGGGRSGGEARARQPASFTLIVASRCVSRSEERGGVGRHTTTAIPAQISRGPRRSSLLLALSAVHSQGTMWSGPARGGTHTRGVDLCRIEVESRTGSSMSTVPLTRRPRRRAALPNSDEASLAAAGGGLRWTFTVLSCSGGVVISLADPCLSARKSERERGSPISLPHSAIHSLGTGVLRLAGCEQALATRQDAELGECVPARVVLCTVYCTVYVPRSMLRCSALALRVAHDASHLPQDKIAGAARTFLVLSPTLSRPRPPPLDLTLSLSLSHSHSPRLRPSPPPPPPPLDLTNSSRRQPPARPDRESPPVRRAAPAAMISVPTTNAITFPKTR